MNSFGRVFRVNIFGESHGESVGIIIDGCPAGLSLTVEDFLEDMERRKGGKQKGTTPRQEDDIPIFKSGIFNGHTTGAPITILFENNNTRSSDYEKLRAVPRPGHADFVAHHKFGGFEDYRGGGHFQRKADSKHCGSRRYCQENSRPYKHNRTHNRNRWRDRY
jgi:chorismate synthase